MWGTSVDRKRKRLECSPTVDCRRTETIPAHGELLEDDERRAWGDTKAHIGKSKPKSLNGRRRPFALEIHCWRMREPSRSSMATWTEEDRDAAVHLALEQHTAEVGERRVFNWTGRST